MTERTYLKDLTIVMVHFREYMTSDTAAQSILAQLYDRLQPLYSAHSTFLELIEKRMSQCDSRISDSLTVEIGDLIRDHFNNIEVSHMPAILVLPGYTSGGHLPCSYYF